MKRATLVGVGIVVTDRGFGAGSLGALSRSAAIAACLLVGGCQSAARVDEPAEDRTPYINEFQKIDAAHAGRITIDQATDYYTNLFKQLDVNHDGTLSESEVAPLVPAMYTTSPAQLIDKLDRNRDGKLTLPEFLVIVNWLFQLGHGTELTAKDVQTGVPGRDPGPKRKDPADTPPTSTAGRR